jgi:hypothetical protein
MRQLLYGLIFLILGVFGAMTYEWARDNFVPPPSSREIPKGARVQHPEFDHLREIAVRGFAEIPQAERQRLRANLASSITSIDTWLESLTREPPQLICIGERHDDATRAFLARRFFAHYPADALMLEMRGENLAILLRLMDAGSPRLSVLDADIAGIIRAAKQANPAVVVHGIEESREQVLARFETRAGSREESIVENFRARFRQGRRHAVLYGALHCADDSQWFIHRIRQPGNGIRVDQTLSVNVINAHESGGIEAFVNFLEDNGLPSPPFVIPRTAALDAEFSSWFPTLMRNFQHYDAAIVFTADNTGS